MTKEYSQRCRGVTDIHLDKRLYWVNFTRFHQKFPKYVLRSVKAALNHFSSAATMQAKQSACWDGDVLYNQTLVGGINAGVFTDNGKADSMEMCMQFCCKKSRCDLAFMIEDDCYSVACSAKDKCEPRKARPTHFYPRIALSKSFKGWWNRERKC